ncbi:proline iminopeptidase-family hydrolase [Streptomyces vilmorinianum]|uniref:proline iminopeptidase-family hydrolase n=1 Tax=Streptomyces vilmorinianum TaxID=3051092 RepID=UPI001586E784|nr:proline iminopeptidase-family hydrolase [Streptomyces vilmorinianum]
MAVTEGTVPFRGFHTWYQVVGELPGPGGKPPLLVVNGGPGCPHDYLRHLSALAEGGGRTVVFYDQFGCGRSAHADDPALWVMDTFVDELGAVRQALGLDPVHLYGHSFGTQVALEYMLGRPSGVASLVLAGPLSSAPLYQEEARRLKATLPAAVQETLDRHEAAGTVEDEEYTEATTAYYRRFLCRSDPWPDELVYSLSEMREDVYATMWGTEWNVTGNLKDWDVTDRLGELDLPVLLTSGRYDATTPAVVRPIAEGIPDAEWVLFEGSAHIPSIEEPERYREVLESFLARVEAG